MLKLVFVSKININLWADILCIGVELRDNAVVNL